MSCNRCNDDRKALAVTGAFILVCLMAWLFTGCASTPIEEPDPCDGCPFTERLVEVWSPPDLEPVPDYPVLVAETFPADQIDTEFGPFVQALITDHLVLKAAVVELHHLYESLVKAIEESEKSGID